MNKIYLNGTWELKCLTPEHSIQCSANVPGCVHTDLLDNQLIDDPYYRDNELKLQWIGESDWIYSRHFTLNETDLHKDHLELVCEGLDTFAKVEINGHQIAETNNMFRSWNFDAKPLLKEGNNEIAITFKSPISYGMQCQKEHYLTQTGIGHHRIEGGHWVRKEACNYGWDWGPMLVTAGIWRPIYIAAWDDIKLEEVHPTARPTKAGHGEIRLKVRTTRTDKTSTATIAAKLQFNGALLTDQAFEVEGDLDVTIPVENIKRWWPAGMGEQPLYDLEVSLIDPNGKRLETESYQLGFRELKLVTEFDEWGQSFNFRANGVDFFAKGANWIPADTFDNRVSTEDIRSLLQSSVDANMNCIRVWGGALYERDEFYDICDELGICVWQDFAFACSAYPLHEPDFVENISIEAEQNIKRLRHHASLALWCGNNELEHIDGFIGDDPGAMRWDHYSHWFDVKLRAIVAEHDPETSYWPASEHSPIGNRTPNTNSSDPRWGDAHLWKVWHGREPFEWYRTSFHRFCSEFGFQSFPHPKTVETFTNEDDRNLTSRVMELHQRSPNGNPNIIHYLLEWFRLPTTWDNTVWLSQILQCMGIKYAVEHWRRNMPRCMGATYWQLNDCWPVASWSSIDSLHRWKALHYDAKRFFARDLLSVVEDAEKQTLELHLTSDERTEREASIKVIAWNIQTGEKLDEQNVVSQTPINGSKLVSVYEASESVRNTSNYDLVFECLLSINGAVVSENMATFSRPKHLNIKDPQIDVRITKTNDGKTEIELLAQSPALWAWIDSPDNPDLRWSDNFVHLFPGQPKRLILEKGEWKNNMSIQAKSLYDTYQ